MKKDEYIKTVDEILTDTKENIKLYFDNLFKTDLKYKFKDVYFNRMKNGINAQIDEMFDKPDSAEKFLFYWENVGAKDPILVKHQIKFINF